MFNIIMIEKIVIHFSTQNNINNIEMVYSAG